MQSENPRMQIFNRSDTTNSLTDLVEPEISQVWLKWKLGVHCCLSLDIHVQLVAMGDEMWVGVGLGCHGYMEHGGPLAAGCYSG